MTAPDPLADVLDALPPMPTGARTFWSTLLRMAPTTTSVGGIAGALGVTYSTLNSRFLRQQLPSPKDHLVMVRLELLAHEFTRDPRITNATYSLGFASPQSMGRHIRSVLGITASEFRATQSPHTMRARWLDGLVLRHAGRWATFDPVGGRDGRDLEIGGSIGRPQRVEYGWR